MSREEDANSSAHLEERLRFEALLAELSSEFINLPAEEVDRVISDAQRRVCECLGLDVSTLWQWSAQEPDTVIMTHLYRPLGGEPVPQRMSGRDHFPWCMRELKAGRVIALERLSQAPPEAARDLAGWRRYGVKSVLTFPLSAGGGALFGALNFSTMLAEHSWGEALVSRLRLVAQIFANALARKRTDLALRESEARLSLAADSAGAGLWELDCRTRVFWITERALAIFGYLPGEVVSMERFEASVHPDDLERVRQAIDRALRESEPIDMEYRIRLGDGRLKWIASRGRPHFTPNGETQCLLGLSVDVTPRKADEERLRESEARLSAAVAVAGLGFYELRGGPRHGFYDDHIRSLLGIPEEQGHLLREFWNEHLHPDDRDRILNLSRQVLEGGRNNASSEYRYQHPQRGTLWLNHAAQVLERGPQGEAVRVVGVVQDITGRKRAEDALHESYTQIAQLKDQLQAERDYLKAEIKVTQAHGEVIGRSASIRQVLGQVEQVAPTDSSILITGETGVGKELIAQAVHRLSPRKNQLMVKINCAALPAALVESELFGREKGAFTGAMTRQMGRFEAADGSTIFLDEIGELSLEVQAKLLRVLQEGHFERLGSHRTIQVNVRVIAATNRDLAGEIRQGRFREDLYYRLNVFPIRVPPLRERAEDIPFLVWAFLEELSSRMGKRITQVPRGTMEALQRHPWPGNVRELRNVIEHGAIITTGDTLRLPMLEDAPAPADPPRTLAESEREHILKALERTGWRVKGPKGAAGLLGLNPSTLYSRMERLGIPHRRQKESAAEMPPPPPSR